MTLPPVKKPGRARPLVYGDRQQLAGSTLHALTFDFRASLTTGAKPFRIYNGFDITLRIHKVTLAVGTAPTGSAIIVDVNLTGVTIFTNQVNRPQIPAGGFYGESTKINVVEWNPGEYLTYDIDQIGSSTAGANLVVMVLAH